MTMDSRQSMASEPYVFLSYARSDVDAAKKVEAFLLANGVRVFRDERDIRVGEDWMVRVDGALRECDRMVLLLSKTSMPYRKEVHLEWTSFDLERKPIYPLQIEACELFYRLRVYNFIDARADWEGSLARLLGELRGEFTPPAPITAAERVNIIERGEAEARTLPEALQALRDAVLDPRGSVVLSAAQVAEIRDHKPADLASFRLGRIAEWSLPRYFLDKRFVALTLAT
jgi:hypothetical protein